MANQVQDEALAAIEEAVRRHPGGVSAPENLRVLATPVPPRTLQYRLKHLVTQNRLAMDGAGRWAKLLLPGMVGGDGNAINLLDTYAEDGMTPELTEGAVRAADRRVRFVGFEAYQAAGGAVMRDLFQPDDGGRLQDPALLDRLLTEKF